ncbi:hypothetical protein KDX38_07960 [Pseudomonas sp. CDFA 602]|nr:hypothetical protein [Pseudomonas californiensis]MCD5999147.1 hypothetical protein [Pseudomonas californiensis]
MLSLQRRHAYRSSRNRVTDHSHSSVQYRAMQSITLAKLRRLVEKASGFALELIVNLKFHLIIHRYLPESVAIRRLKMSTEGYWATLIGQSLSR